MSKINITPPVVHMNGSGLKTLKESYDAAGEKIEDFVEAWGKIEFNARDYYPSGPEAYEAAREHRYKIAHLIAEVQEYITDHRIHLYNL